MAEQSDLELLQDLDRNRERAFRALYVRYASVLLRFVYRFCPNQEQAEEIIHDIFLELLKEPRPSFSDGGLKPWLFTVAKNKSLNHKRKHSREVLSDEGVAMAIDPKNLEESIGTEQILKQILSSESALPKDLQETWGLRRQGLDYQQIADQLKIPLGTVKSRFNRLTSYFREEILNEPK